jgi:hypothetical protein
MNTNKLLSAASGAVLALGIASSSLSPSPASAQGYGAPPPPPPSYAPPPPNYGPPPSGYNREHDKSMLKLCKVAGEGVKPGEIFAFAAEPNGGKVSIVIPAGLGEGYCQIIGVYPVGTEVNVREQIPNGYDIESITAEPAGTITSQDPERGTIKVKLPVGVTEIKIVNRGPSKGAMEICKIGGREGARYEFSYMDQAGNMQQTHTLANACTPVIWVRSGRQVITELNANGQMTDGTAYPAWRFVSADRSKGQIVVQIPRGGTMQTQTVVTFENRREGKGY